VEDPLSEKILWKEFSAGTTILVDARDGEIAFETPETPDVPPVEMAGQGKQESP
jgi:ATP-dependent Clp protease ATP-binding subunit ClpC